MLLLLRLNLETAGVVEPPVVVGPSNEIDYRPFYVKRGKRIMLFNSAAEADAYLEAEAAAEKAIADAQKTSRRARKRLRERVLSVAVEPLETLEIPLLETLVGRYEIPVNLPELIAQQDWERVMQIHALALEMQEEDDIELLLLA